MSCEICFCDANFETCCRHLFCFSCFSTYIKNVQKYPIVCMICTQILTPKECVENLFGDDLNIFKNLKDNFLVKQVIKQVIKRKRIRLPLKYKCKYKCADSDEIIHLKEPTEQKVSIASVEHPRDQSFPQPIDKNVNKSIEKATKGTESIIVAYAKFGNTYGRCSEKELINLCKLSGWLYSQRTCQKLHCNRILNESTYKGEPIWRCYRCSSIFRLKQNTWFSRSRLGFYDILQVTFCWILDLTQSTTMKITGKCKYTVTNWFKKCRKHVIEIIEKYAWKIGGPDVHVDIDLVLFGRARIVKHSRLRPQWYIGLIEQENKLSLMVLPIEDCNMNTLDSIIAKWVEPGSIIHTDEWSGFKNLNNLGYKHVVYNQNSAESAFGQCTDAMQKSWNLLRSGCPERGSKRKYYTSYMMTKIWRERNEGSSSLEKFQQFMNTTLNCKCSKKI